MNQKPTVSIGIPAHNEEQNIAVMVDSVLKQKGDFTLEKVLVVCDGCTDRTAEIVTEMARNNPQIELLNDGQRLGKASRLNQMYQWCQSELIGTFDADIAFDRDCELDLMVKELVNHPETKVAAARLIPVKTNTLMGKAAEVSYKSFEDAVLRLNNGNNYYCLVGCASLIKTEFAKTVVYPKDVISDMNYLYTLATKEHDLGVRLARQSRILFRGVTTFQDWRILALRATKADKSNLASFFGKEVFKKYTMPKSLAITSQLKWLLKSPVYMSISILMNIFIRLFPLQSQKPKNGIWQDTRSSKAAIK